MSADSADRREFLSRSGAALNEERTDMPEVYVLQIADNAWGDMGLASREVELYNLPKLHQLLAKFVGEFADSPRKINDGLRIAVVKGQRVDRIRSQAWRGAVWWDAENATEWLCRAISLDNYPEETKAYNEFRRLHAVK
jgi:hypothetical protein